MSVLKQRNSAFVLTYHRVLISPRQDDSIFVQPGTYVTVESFRQQLTFLKEKFQILSLSELLKRVDSGKSVSGCCSVTFDDGWLDNYTNAFPVLHELQIPSTIFLATAVIGTNRMFWPEELSFYLRQPAVISSLAGIDPQLCSSASFDNNGLYLDNSIQIVKNYTPEKREALFSFLRSTSTSLPSVRMLMNWEEAREMHASSLVSFGAHSANHVILDQVPLEIAEEEIINSRDEIEFRLGKPPELFAYPNGNYSKDLQALLKEKGFNGAVTTRKGWFNKNADLYEIPRIGIHEDISSTIPLFFARLLLERF